MPRGFTEEESLFYRNKLIKVGSELFAKNGVAGVSLDQITRGAGIGKGSFYKFFKNKEDLCYDCLMELDERLKNEMLESMKEYLGTPGLLMKKLIRDIPKAVEENPLLSFFRNNGELESLMLRVDKSKHIENFTRDSLFFQNSLKDTGILDVVNGEDITSLLWAVVFLHFNKECLNGQYESVLNLLGNMAESHFSRGVS